MRCAWQHFENLKADRWHVGQEQNARFVSSSLKYLGEGGASSRPIYHPNRRGRRSFELDRGFNRITTSRRQRIVNNQRNSPGARVQIFGDSCSRTLEHPRELICRNQFVVPRELI